MKTDKQLKRDVEEELSWEPVLREEQIGVSVKDGVVELDGEVGSFPEKWAAERAALRVADVKAVASEIRVVVSTTDSESDEDIARAAINHLAWNQQVPEGIKVQVSDGWITLKGEVAWNYEREEAERTVRFLNGVKGVVNEITLKPQVTASGVKTKIQDALKRSAAVDAGTIQVETAGGMVTLRGQVKAWAEREEAERAAWSAPGVTEVQDLIKIG